MPLQYTLLRAQALVQLGAAEAALYHFDSAEADREAVSAENDLTSGLAANPFDAYLWLMLYKLRNERNGFSALNARLLSQSYSTGPLEGWIILPRIQLALATFAALDPSVQDMTVLEFAGIVSAGFIDQAVNNLTGEGWLIRDRLAAALINTDIYSRQQLSKRLGLLGIKLSLPGISIE